MNKFTKNVFMDKYGCIVSDESKSGTGAIMLSGVALSMTDNADAEIKSNTELTFTAFKTATKLAEQGYDAIKTLELLPELLNTVDESLHSGLTVELYYEINSLLEQCRGDHV